MNLGNTCGYIKYKYRVRSQKDVQWDESIVSASHLQYPSEVILIYSLLCNFSEILSIYVCIYFCTYSLFLCVVNSLHFAALQTFFKELNENIS